MGAPGGRGAMFGAASGKRYNVTSSLSAANVLNHANDAPPGGDLPSTYFGICRSLAGFGRFGAARTYNSRVDIQLRFKS